MRLEVVKAKVVDEERDKVRALLDLHQLQGQGRGRAVTGVGQETLLGQVAAAAGGTAAKKTGAGYGAIVVRRGRGEGGGGHAVNFDEPGPWTVPVQAGGAQGRMVHEARPSCQT